MWLTGLLWAVWTLLLLGGLAWWTCRVHRRLVAEQRQREASAVRIAQEAWKLKKAGLVKEEASALRD